ncbi:MAG: hypothetical protein V4646_14420 [Pseudomonadota bacterium]
MNKDYSVKQDARKMAAAISRHGVSKTHAEKRTLRSIGTERTYRDVLCVLGKWLWMWGKKLISANHKDGTAFLIFRATQVCQKTLDRDRLILSRYFNNDLKKFVSKISSREQRGRAYPSSQIMRMMMMCADPRLAISIELCHHAGLRATELNNISRPEDRPESARNWREDRFHLTSDQVLYTVHGKGGLVRSVTIPRELAQRLEMFRRSEPVQIEDREIKHRSFYDIESGKKFSARFGRLSQNILGFSHGAHGLRYGYVQRRLLQLVISRIPFERARLIVANEIGHFSPANIRYYLVGCCFHQFLKSGGACELKKYDPEALQVMAETDWKNLIDLESGS